jgi:two-component system, chemotaxis family, protein-glutamate methylesterase/glutaminase
LGEQRIVVIGASAGGVEALIEIVRGLPPDFPAPVCVVIHIPPTAPTLLPDILTREGILPAVEGIDGEPHKAGTIYIAPPDRHLLVMRNGTLRASRGPRENRHRPAIDPLFRSAAAALGPGVVGVILTGALDDGTAGLLAVKQQGGIAIVQDPQTAVYQSMPRSALDHVEVDHVVPLQDIARVLTMVLQAPIPAATHHHRPHPDIHMEVRMAEMDPDAMQEDERPGHPSPFSCPDCGGVLWEIGDETLTRYRCRVGHAFSPESMLGAQAEKLEEALWTAAKTLEESARLSKRLARSERQRGNTWLAERFEQKEREARERVEVIRKFLARDTTEVPA